MCIAIYFKRISFYTSSSTGGLRIMRIVVVVIEYDSDSDSDKDNDIDIDLEYVEYYINKVFFA